MRSILIHFAILLVLVINAPQAAVSQTNPPNLVDQFNGFGGEGRMSYFESFILELKKEPKSKGVVVIHGQYDNPIIAYKQKKMFENLILVRKFDADRIVFIRGNDEREIRTELWKLYEDEVGTFKGHPWDFKISEPVISVLAHCESWQSSDLTTYAFTTKFYAEFLKANEDLIGRIIVRETSLASFNRTKTKITNELVKKNGVTTKQLDFAYIKSDLSDVEYWYVGLATFPR